MLRASVPGATSPAARHPARSPDPRDCRRRRGWPARACRLWLACRSSSASTFRAQIEMHIDRLKAAGIGRMAFGRMVQSLQLLRRLVAADDQSLFAVSFLLHDLVQQCIAPLGPGRATLPVIGAAPAALLRFLMAKRVQPALDRLQS